MDTNFIAWLTEEMDKRLWTNTDLARAAGVGQPMVSMVVSGQKKPGLKFCTGVAKAFGVPAEQVLRRAGLIPPLPGPEEDQTLKELFDIARRLPRNERKRLANLALTILREQDADYNTGGTPAGNNASQSAKPAT